jgi:uncharacterized membrane protein YfcA
MARFRGLQSGHPITQHAGMHLTLWQWTLLSFGAVFTGLSKTGLPGLGVLTVALFANVLPARASTGALLPLLLCADVFGVSFYRKHASWPHLWKLFPWVVVGVLGGCMAMDRVSNAQVQRMIGGIVLGVVGLHLWRQRQGEAMASRIPHTWWFAALTGIVAGFTTMVANAAGPVMVLYLLAVGLPKLAFVGTGAWFFLLVNALKVPLSAGLGLITKDSLVMDAVLVLPMVPGALLGPVVLSRINQQAFEFLVVAFTVVAALRLLV